MSNILKEQLRIISLLRENGRKSLTRIARKLSVPISTVYERLKSANRVGIIKKNTLLLDFSKIGMHCKVYIALKVKKFHRSELRKLLISSQNVNNLFHINNGFDYLVEAIFQNVKDVEQFIDVLEDKVELTNYQIFYVIDDVKRETFLSDLTTARLVYQELSPQY